jgi:hypothetical protein
VIVTLGRILTAAKSDAVLGLGDADRAKVIDTIERAVELASYKANYNPWMATIDVNSDDRGIVTLPNFVGTVLQANVCGRPSIFANELYRFHINGPGDACGMACGMTQDIGWSPIWQDLYEWAVVAAICEDPIDGDGSKVMVVEGETMDQAGNIKPAITIPVSGPSSAGVNIPLIYTYANTDSAASPTYFRRITRVTKPVTRGYVKLIAFAIRQMALSVTLGYYEPNDTNPTYRRISVGTRCACVRVRFRRSSITLVNNYDVVPIASYQATIDLLKSIRYSDDGNPQLAEVYLGRAVRLLNEVQSIESGHTYSPIQVDPSWSIGTIDYR